MKNYNLLLNSSLFIVAINLSIGFCPLASVGDQEMPPDCIEAIKKQQKKANKIK